MYGAATKQNLINFCHFKLTIQLNLVKRNLCNVVACCIKTLINCIYKFITLINLKFSITYESLVS